MWYMCLKRLLKTKEKKVSVDQEIKKAQKDVIEKPIPKSCEGLGSYEKVKQELTREERVEVLRTKKILSGRVFDSEVLPKSGICYLVDVAENFFL